ncbi:Ig-like domain-containing protein [Halomonas salifodinae]
MAESKSYDAGTVKVRQTLDAKTTATGVNAVAWSIDTTPPTVTIEADASTLVEVDGTETVTQASGDVWVTLSFSEAIHGLAEADLDVANGQVVAGSLAPVPNSDTAYRVLVRPATATEGELTVGLAAGAELEDGAGNALLDPAAQSLSVALDTQAPDAPTVALANDTGDQAGVTSDSSLALGGVGEGDTLHVYVDGVLHGSVMADANGEASYDFGVQGDALTADGSVYQIRVTATNAAGNVSGDGALAFVFSEAALDAAPGVALAEDTGSVAGVTSNDTIEVTLAAAFDADAGDSWEYSSDAGQSWQAGSGTGFTLAEGDYAPGDIQVRQTVDGNESATGLNAVAWSIDTTPPTVTLELDPATALVDVDGTETVTQASGDVWVTLSFSEVIHGLTEADLDVTNGELVEGSLSPVLNSDTAYRVLVRPTADTEGELTVGLAAGAELEDGAGNMLASPGDQSLSVALDTQAPAAPTVTLELDPATALVDVDGTETVTQASGDVWVTLSFSEAIVGLSEADLDVTHGQVVAGTLAAVLNSETEYRVLVRPGAGEEGQLTVGLAAGAELEDGAGNTLASPGDQSLSVALDTQAPDAPTVALANDTGEQAGVTSDSTLALGGVGEGDTLRVYVDGVLHGSVTADANGEASYDFATDGDAGQGALTADGSVYQLRVTATDAAGNVSGDGALAFVLSEAALDEAPGVALSEDTGSVAGVTSNDTIEVTLAAAFDAGAGDSWEYSSDAGQSWQAGSGTGFTLAEGDYAPGDVQVRQTVDGNVSATGVNAEAWSIDATPPTVTLELDPATALVDVDGTETVTQASGDVWVTLTFSEAIHGLTEADLDVTNGDLVAGTLAAVLNSETEYRVLVRPDAATEGQLTVGLAAGAELEDGAGNTLASPGDQSLSVALDTQAPDAPTVALANDTGDQAGVTADSTLALGGVGEGDTLRVYVDGVLHGSVTADANGEASYDFATDGDAGQGALTADGSVYQLRVTATDAAGNVSGDGALAFVLSEAALDEAPGVALSEDTGSVAGVTSNDTIEVTLAAAFDAGAGDSWEYSTNGGTDWSVGSGTGFTLAEGDYAPGDIQVRQTVDGNPSATGVNAEAWTVDATPPTVTLELDPATALVDVDGTETVTQASGDVWVTLTFSEAIHGLTEADLDVTNGDLVAGTLAAVLNSETEYRVLVRPDAATEGQLTVGLAAGAELEDGAGNTLASPGDQSLSVALDTQAPDAPTVALANDTGDQAGVTADSSLALGGVGEGDTLRVYVDGVLHGSVTADANGEASYDFGVQGDALTADGSVYQLRVTATDAAGNVSDDGALAFVLSEAALDAAPGVALSEDTGSVAGVTSDGEVTVSLAAAFDAGAGDSWEYSTNGGTDWSVGSGTGFTLAEGDYAPGDIQVRQTVDGNPSATGVNAEAWSIDATPPTVTLELDPATALVDVDGTETVTQASGDVWVTLSFSEAIVGLSEADLDVTNGDLVAGTLAAVLNSETEYRVLVRPDAATEGQLTVGLAAGAELEDGAGNTLASPGDQSLSVALDTQAPDAPTVALANDTGEQAGVTSDSTLALGGVGEGDTLRVYVDGVLHGSVTADANGEASYDFATDGDAGQGALTADGSVYQLRVTATDAAGNVSDDGALAFVLSEAALDEAPGVALSEDTGSVAGVTSDGEVTVSLAAAFDAGAGDSWEYSTNGGTDWSVGSGTGFTLAEGDYAPGDIQVRQTVDGNPSATGVNAEAWSIDATPPTVTLELDPATALVDVDGTETVTQASGDVWVTLTFSEAIVGLSEADLDVTNGDLVAGTLAAVLNSETEYRVLVRPDAATEGQLTVGLAAGAELEDGAGNTLASPGDQSLSVALDTQAPDAPTVALANDTGDQAGVTADSTLALGGVGEGDTLRVYVDGVLHGSVTADANGEASYDFATDGDAGQGALTADGSVYQLRVTATDAAGNVSGDGALAFVLSEAALDEAPGVALSEDTGSVAGVTSNDTIEVTLAAAFDAGAGDSWEYSSDAGQSWQAGSGTGFTLAEGDYAPGDVQVRQTVDGNVSATGVNAEAWSIDATPPTVTLELDPATALVDVDGTETVTQASGDVWVTLSFSEAIVGLSEADLDVTHGQVVAGTLAAVLNSETEYRVLVRPGAGEEGQLTVGLAAGAELEDGAGNTLASPGDQSLSVALDTQAPDAPTVALANDTGEQAGVTSDSTLALGGVGEGDTLRVYVDGVLHGSVTADANGEASYDFATDGDAGQGALTADGSVYQLRVTATDAAGNVSGDGALAFVLSEAALDEAPGVALSEDTGSVAGVTSNDTIEVTLAAAFDAGAGDSWEYSSDAGQSWQAGSGTGFTLAEGDYAPGDVQVRQTVDGNVSATGVNAEAWSIDATPPTVTLELDPATALVDVDGTETVTQASGDVWVTLTFSEAIHGLTEADLDVTNGDLVAGTLAAVLNSETEYRVLVRPDAGEEGQLTVGLAAGAELEDGAGNTLASPGDQSLSVALDTKAPDAPTVALAEDTGSVTGVTHHPEVTVSGLEAGASWEYSTDAGQSWQAGSDTSFSLAEGDYAPGMIQVRQEDVAGNRSEAGGNTQAWTLDTTPPSLSIDSSAPAVINSTTGPVWVYLVFDEPVVGFSEANLAVTNGSLVADSLVEIGSGQQSYRVQLAADDDLEGLLTLEVNNVADGAGNLLSSATHELTVDTLVPAAPSLALDEDTGSVSGVTQNDTLVITAEAGGTVRVYAEDGGFLGEASESDPGSYAFTPGLDDGDSLTLTATVTDAAGNVSEGSAPLSVTLYSEPPTIEAVAFTSEPDALHGLYAQGDEIEITLTLNRSLAAITVDDPTPPTLDLELLNGASSTTVQAVWQGEESADGTTLLRFGYTVQLEDQAAEGIRVIADSLALNGATLEDGAGNALDGSFAGLTDASQVIDNDVVVITGLAFADDEPINAYPADDELDVVVQLSDGVTWEGTGGSNPTLTLIDDQDTEYLAAYHTTKSDPAAGTLVFSYPVQDGDNAAQLGVQGNDPLLTLYGWTLAPVDGDKSLLLGHDGLAPSDQYRLDTTPPDLAEATFDITFDRLDPTLDYLTEGDEIRLVVDFGEALALTLNGATPTLALGQAMGAASYDASQSDLAQGRLAFVYTVGENDLSQDGLFLAADPLDLDGAALTDLAGNAAQLGFSGGRVDALSVITSEAPVITQAELWATPMSGWYDDGDTIQVRLHFHDAIDLETGGGSPSLNLQIGDSLVTATYASHDAAAGWLQFQATAPADEYTEAIAVPADALALNGASLTATDGTTPAVLTHPALSLVGGVDSLARVITEVSAAAPDNGVYYADDETLQLEVNFNRPMSTSGDFAATLAVTIGGEAFTASYDAAASAATDGLVFTLPFEGLALDDGSYHLAAGSLNITTGELQSQSGAELFGPGDSLASPDGTTASHPLVVGEPAASAITGTPTLEGFIDNVGDYQGDSADSDRLATNHTTDDTTPTLYGDGEAGRWVAIEATPVGGASAETVAYTLVDDSGSWQVETPALDPGGYHFSARYYDPDTQDVGSPSAERYLYVGTPDVLLAGAFAGVGNGHMNEDSQLILPFSFVDDAGEARLFYAFDGNGNGVLGDSVDRLRHSDDLPALLNDGNRLDAANSDAPGGSADEPSFEARSTDLDGVTIALPLRDELQALAAQAGVQPAGWSTDFYWSATPASSSMHDIMRLTDGLTSTYDDTINGVVAFEVL